MSVTSVIEFDESEEHVFNPAFLTLLDDKGQLKSQVNPNEILFSNFDTNSELTSKRGAKELVFSGTANTGVVADGVMKFANTDASRGAYEGITEIVDDFAFRARCIININPTTSRDFIRLLSNVDSSSIRFSASNQGGGVTRITREIYNGAGSLVHSVVCGTLTVNPGVSTINLAFSCDADGTSKTFYNGALISTVATPMLNFSNCELRFNNNTQAVASFDNVQMFRSDAITAGFANPLPESTTYVLTEQIMTTKIQLIVDEIESLDITSETPTGSQLKHFMYLNGVPYGVSSGNWVQLDLTQPMLAQSNTLAELQAALSTIPIVKGIGKTVEIAHVFRSDTGYATPLIETVTAKYFYTFKSGDVRVCAVHGTILDNAGNAVAGAKIWVQTRDKFINNAFIGPSAKVVSAADGKFSIGVPVNSTVDFIVEYLNTEPNGATELASYVQFRHRNKIIPDLPSAPIETLQNDV